MEGESIGVALVCGAAPCERERSCLWLCSCEYLEEDMARYRKAPRSLGLIWVRMEILREDRIVSVRHAVFSRDDGWNMLASCRVGRIQKRVVGCGAWERYLEHQVGTAR